MMESKFECCLKKFSLNIWFDLCSKYIMYIVAKPKKAEKYVNELKVL